MAARSAGKCRVEDLVSIHIPTTGGSLKETQGSVADDLEHGGQELPPDSPSAYVSTDQASSAPAQQIDTVKAAAAFETLSITLAQQSISEGGCSSGNVGEHCRWFHSLMVGEVYQENVPYLGGYLG